MSSSPVVPVRSPTPPFPERDGLLPGSPGTGKSVLLREIISAMKRKYKSTPDAVAVTASTGMAACNIGGTTIHSFGGIGLGEGSAKDLTNKVRKNRKASGRWLRAKVLVIDEGWLARRDRILVCCSPSRGLVLQVSMLDAELFDKLAEIGKVIKKKDKPFGGIQVSRRSPSAREQVRHLIHHVGPSPACDHWGFLSAAASHQGQGAEFCVPSQYLEGGDRGIDRSHAGIQTEGQQWVT